VFRFHRRWIKRSFHERFELQAGTDQLANEHGERLMLNDDRHAFPRRVLRRALIGIRVALGSPRSRVVVTILRRPLMQLTFGSVFGALLTVGVSRLMELTVGFSLRLIAVGPIIFAVCLLACIVPARRALRVDPIAALRAE